MNARRLFAVGSLAAALAMVVGGCLLDSDKSPVINERGGEINITVSDGLTPEYSWDGGDCFRVDVRRADDPAVTVWGAMAYSIVDSPAKRALMSIPSPVRHGVAPAGAVVFASREKRLVAGVRYRIVIVRDAGAVELLGWVEFTPQ